MKEGQKMSEHEHAIVNGQAVDFGCYIDGNRGRRDADQMLHNLAVEHGYRTPEGEINMHALYELVDAEVVDVEVVDDLVDELIEYLGSVTEGGWWIWADGLVLAPEDELAW